MTEISIETEGQLLGAADIRRIAAEEGITPTKKFGQNFVIDPGTCLLYTSPSPRDRQKSRMPSSA